MNKKVECLSGKKVNCFTFFERACSKGKHEDTSRRATNTNEVSILVECLSGLRCIVGNDVCASTAGSNPVSTANKLKYKKYGKRKNNS